MEVEKDEQRALDRDKHVRSAIVVDIAEGEGDGSEVLTGTKQDGTGEDDAFGGIASGEFDDEDVAMEVEGDEMAGMQWGVVVTDDLVDLEGARSSEVPVIQGGLPPGAESGESDPSQEHDGQGASRDDQPAHMFSMCQLAVTEARRATAPLLYVIHGSRDT